MKRPSKQLLHLSQPRNRRAAPPLLVVCAALSVTAGCSSTSTEAGNGAPVAPPLSASATLSAEEIRARKDVITAYQAMTDAQIAAYAHASVKDSRITQYATGKALRDVKDAVFVNVQNDIVFTGEPKVTAVEEDVDLDLGGTPQRATLNLCFDMNTWAPVNKKTGKSVAAPARTKRYTVIAHLQNRADRWQVTEESADKDTPC